MAFITADRIVSGAGQWGRRNLATFTDNESVEVDLTYHSYGVRVAAVEWRVPPRPTCPADLHHGARWLSRCTCVRDPLHTHTHTHAVAPVADQIQSPNVLR